MPKAESRVPDSVCLIANYKPDAQPSMLRYAQLLERILRESGYRAQTVHPPAVLGGFVTGKGVGKWIRYIDKFLLAPVYLRWKTRSADIVHVCDHSYSMYLGCAGKKLRLVTCHDLIAVRSARGEYPGIRTGRTGRLLQQWIAMSLGRARHVICDSEKTQSDLRVLYPESKAPSSVIYLSLNDRYYPTRPEEISGILASYGVRYQGYLMHVGGDAWYKNRRGALCIFAEMRKFPAMADTKLLLVGAPMNRETREFCRASSIEPFIVEAIRVPVDTLRAFYSGAGALLFPSLIEGFGWPIIEAQACGCPVITSNRPPMTEVAGEAAILIDPEQPEEAARNILKQWPRLGELREAGFRNLARFSEEGMTAGYLRVYREVLGISAEGAEARERSGEPALRERGGA
jgi:glycosyltransferase involved in cell wall biosynthesis